MEYKLQNDELQVGIGTYGAALTSIKDATGVEYLWQGFPAFWSGQAPVLFPICGSIRDDKATTEDGHELAMPRHGLVRKREFRYVCGDHTSAFFAIDADEQTLAGYPYDFELSIKYGLEGRTITTTYTVENRGDEPMPYLIGGHPGFRCPLLDGESYEDYYLEFEKDETCDVPTQLPESGLIDMGHRTPLLKGTNRLPLSHDLFAVDAITLDALESRAVTLRSTTNDRSVRLDFADFPYLIMWSTANKGPFIALEPWLGLSTCSDEDDVFEHKRNCQVLAPGEARSHSFAITIV